jgi:menaquinone-dependent protoporphyrinogen oxidase
MSRFLVAYRGLHGQTAKIAHRIVEVLREEGHRVELRDDLGEPGPNPAAYDAVIVGGSIHRGHYERDLIDWIRHRRVALTMTPSAFFSVCLVAADEGPEAREAALTYIDELEEDTGWTPRYRRTFAGALRYRSYDFATRLLMRVLMRRGGHPTDIRRDYEYTDWDAVDGFARDCARLTARTACS